MVLFTSFVLSRIHWQSLHFPCCSLLHYSVYSPSFTFCSTRFLFPPSYLFSSFSSLYVFSITSVSLFSFILCSPLVAFPPNPPFCLLFLLYIHFRSFLGLFPLFFFIASSPLLYIPFILLFFILTSFFFILQFGVHRLTVPPVTFSFFMLFTLTDFFFPLIFFHLIITHLHNLPPRSPRTLVGSLILVARE